MQQNQGYEFNDEQNRLIANLATKMLSVGWFISILGLVVIAQAAVLGMKISDGHLKTPQGVKEWLAWLPVLSAVICAIIFLAIGLWSRSSGTSFQKISASQNRDMWHLGNALASLHSMFSLLNSLIVIALLVMIASIAAHFLTGVPTKAG